jgi:hypothetical protein
MKVGGCQPYAPAAFVPRVNLVLICRGWVDPRAHGTVRCHGKNPGDTGNRSRDGIAIYSHHIKKMDSQTQLFIFNQPSGRIIAVGLSCFSDLTTHVFISLLYSCFHKLVLNLWESVRWKDILRISCEEVYGEPVDRGRPGRGDKPATDLCIRC